MSAKRLSPTASLLRSSRLFAVPAPIPRPELDMTSSVTYKSETATLPYPVNAAITTPPSSLCRGDWGLKRPLPLRSTTNTTTPAVRVDAMDTLAHITDFSSAADHTRTLKKWQELNMPMAAADVRRRRATRVSAYDEDVPPRSVFERELDQTATTTGPHAGQRWKFKGPWLPGKTEGDFQRYLTKDIRSQRQAFRDFLRTRLIAQKAAEGRRLAMEQGIGDASTKPATSVSDQELQDFVRVLRHNRAKLEDLIQEFLDLPAITSGGPMELLGTSKALYVDAGPPKTHPSAGLSYLRTASIMTNHPILGPQGQPPPVIARVLQPRRFAGSQNNIAKLGVAGIVVDDSIRASFKHASANSDEALGVMSFKPDIPGGAKIWVRPARAEVDADGRIKLHTERASATSVAIQQGAVDAQTVGLGGNLGSGAAVPEIKRSPRAVPLGSGSIYGLGDVLKPLST